VEGVSIDGLWIKDHPILNTAEGHFTIEKAAPVVFAKP
jgi:hypothetical protein